jgi:hypothetical protein
VSLILPLHPAGRPRPQSAPLDHSALTALADAYILDRHRLTPQEAEEARKTQPYAMMLDVFIIAYRMGESRAIRTNETPKEP